MEEIKWKLSVTGSSAEVLGAAGKLLDGIIKKLNILKKNDKSEELPEMKLVWEMLGSESVVTSQACSDVLVNLVLRGHLDIGATVTGLLASLSHGHSVQGIIPALGRILAHQVMLMSSKGEYKCPYGISSCQHPFVSVLRSTPSAWSHIHDQCIYLLDHPHPDVKSNSLSLLKPLVYFLFCDPNHHVHLGAFRSLLKTYMFAGWRRGDSKMESLVFEIMSWMQMENKENLPEQSQFVFDVIEDLKDRDLDEELKKQIFLLPSLALHQVKFGYSPIKPLHLILSVLDNKPDLIENWDVAMIILNDVLRQAPHIYHESITTVCLRLTECNKTSQIPTGMVVSTALQSLSFPSQLNIEASTKKAELVRLFYKLDWTQELKPNSLQVFQEFSQFDANVSAAGEVAKLSYLINSSEKLQNNWLSNITKSELNEITRLLPLLSSLFLCCCSSGVAKMTLDLMLRCVATNSSYSPQVLTLLLHKLASAGGDPGTRLALLQALPAMAGDKGCVSMILKLVASLSTRPSLTPLRLSLLYRLWRVEPRCYPYLQKALLEPTGDSVSQEICVARAAIVRDIVATHAGQHGSDLLPLLSGLLNQCTGLDGTTAAAIALDGIYSLCKEAVIDMRTTVKVLAPRCSKDTRVMVAVRYCRLLGLAPTFRIQGPEYLSFLADTLLWLWKTATGSSQKQVAQAAYEAIALFPLESTRLKMLPSAAREGLKLPAKYCATPSDAARKPEDVLPYVPSECWPQLLVTAATAAELAGVEALLATLLKQEVNNLPRAVYNLSQAMKNAGAEPVNYNHLPDHSLLRGVLAHLLAAALERRDLPLHPSQQHGARPVLAACLRMMARDMGKPLPPFDWSNLDPLFSDPQLREPLIEVLARQAVDSRSAKIFLERLLSSDQGRDTALLLVQQLPIIAAAIPPANIQPFLTRSLQLSLQAALNNTGHHDDFVKMLSHIKEALEKTDLPEGSIAGLAMVVESLNEGIPADQEELYEEYLDVAAKLPMKNIERMSSPAVWWEVTPAKLYRAASLRTALATGKDTDTPLTWLNEILEVASKQSGDYTFIFRCLLTVLTNCRKTAKQVNTAWLLELMGQMSAMLRKSSNLQPVGQQFNFLFDIFNFAVILLSETDLLAIPRDQLCVSRASRLSLLPLSLCRLLTVSPGLSAQLAEWSYQMSRHKVLTQAQRDQFSSCLVVFKYSKHWQEASVWGRLVPSK